MPVRQVILLGTAYSGSTILGSALHQLDGAYYVGEIGSLPSYHLRLFGHVSPQKIECHTCFLAQRECPRWNRHTLAELESAGENAVHDCCRHLTGCDLVVDGTKFVGWLRRLRDAGAASPEETRIVISARDPFSFCDSMKRREVSEVWQSANLWRDVYTDAQRTSHHEGLPILVVRYPDFMTNRKKVSRNLAAFLERSWVPEMLDSERRPFCTIGGNFGVTVSHTPDGPEKAAAADATHQAYRDIHARYARKTQIDEKWMDGLSPAEVSAIVSMPGVVDTASFLGFDLAERLAAYWKKREEGS